MLSRIAVFPPFSPAIFSGLLGTLGLAVALCAQGPPEALHRRGDLGAVAEARRELEGLRPGLDGLDVLLVTVAGLRPERVVGSGALGRLAEDAFVFGRAFAPSPDPDEALLALLHGQDRWTLGVPGAAEPLPASFEERGYLCWSAAPARFAAPEGFAPRLGVTRALFAADADALGAKTLHERVQETRAADRPLFGWCHLEAEDAEPGLAALLATLERRDRSSRTLLAVVGTPAPRRVGSRGALRGDGFPDGLPGAGGDALDDRSLGVAMLLRIPGLRGRFVEAVVETLDLPATLLALVTRSLPATCQGRPMLDLLVDPEAGTWPGVAFAGGDEAWTLRDAEGRRTATTGELAARAADPRGSALRDWAVATSELTRVWTRRPGDRPEIVGPRAALAEARFLTRLDPEQAATRALALLGGEEAEVLAGALAVVLDCDAADRAETEVLEALDGFPDARVATLRSAVATARGEGEPHLRRTLAAAADPRLDDEDRLRALRAVARGGGEAGREGLAELDLSEAGAEIEAEGVLALARLGDAEADRRLLRLVLDANPVPRRDELVEALVALRGAAAAGVLDLLLSHVPDDAPARLAALRALRRLDARDREDAVARAILDRDPRVSETAAALLDEWNSLAGFEALRRRALGDDLVGADGALRRLLRTPLLGSPALPGALLDGPGRGRTAVATSCPARPGRLALLFSAPANDAPRVRVAALDDDGETAAAAETLALRNLGETWLWIGRPSPLDPNVDRLERRFLIEVGPGEARLEGFAILTDAPLPRPEAALRVEPGAAEQRVHGSLARPEAEGRRLWWSVDGNPGTTGELELLLGDTLLARIDLALAGSSGESLVALPRPPRPGESFELRHRPRADAPAPRLRAALLAEPDLRDPRDR